MPPGIDTRRLTARQTVSRATQAAGVIPIAGAAMGPDLLRTLLRQTVGMTEIILETVAAEHQHLTATRIETLETFLRKQLLVNAGVVLLTAVCFGQRARFDVVARTDAGYPVLWLGMIVVLLGTRRCFDTSCRARSSSRLFLS